MSFRRRISTAVAGIWLRLARPRKLQPEEIARQDFSTHPGGKGLRISERLRDRLRPRWLRLRK